MSDKFYIKYEKYYFSYLEKKSNLSRNMYHWARVEFSDVSLRCEIGE